MTVLPIYGISYLQVKGLEVRMRQLLMCVAIVSTLGFYQAVMNAKVASLQPESNETIVAEGRGTPGRRVGGGTRHA